MTPPTSNHRFPRSTLTQRILSATLLGGAFLGSYIFFPSHGLFWMVFFCSFLILFEGTRLLFHDQSLGFQRILFVLYSLSLGLAWIGVAISLFFVYLSSLFLILYKFFSLPSSLSKERQLLLQATLKTLALFVLGLFYLLLPIFMLLDLLSQPQKDGSLWFFILLCIVFAGDIGGYFAGKRWGKKRKLLSLISPSKSVAGFLGSLFASLLAGGITYKILSLEQINPFLWWSFVFLVSMVAQTGDYFESLLKRVAEKKDSGSFLPGHGGLLDRVDGILFATPLLYALLHYLKHL